MLANNRESGLHLLALNRTDLTVVWDYNYEVMKFEYPASQYSSEVALEEEREWELLGGEE